MEAQQMSQDEEDHESESVRSDATTEENDDDEGRIIIFVIYGRLLNTCSQICLLCMNYRVFSNG